MQTGPAMVGSGAQRVAIAVGLTVLVAILAYSALIFVIVVIQAAAAFGQ